MSAAELILRYASFAAAAAACNLAVQRLVLGVIDPPIGLIFALACGTGAGLVVKYLLDKRWIFADRSSGARAHAVRFSGYTLMGAGTTMIFWGTEIAFYAIWGTDLMREIGAALGLCIGYAVKYRLDRRFVFDRAEAAAPGGGPLESRSRE